MTYRKSAEEEATIEVASWPIEKQIDIITEALNAATERAAQTNDPVHWSVVDGWEKRLMETINGHFPSTGGDLSRSYDGPVDDVDKTPVPEWALGGK